MAVFLSNPNQQMSQSSTYDDKISGIMILIRTRILISLTPDISYSHYIFFSDFLHVFLFFNVKFLRIFFQLSPFLLVYQSFYRSATSEHVPQDIAFHEVSFPAADLFESEYLLAQSIGTCSAKITKSFIFKRNKNMVKYSMIRGPSRRSNEMIKL